jgi:hypothetical protein
MAEPDICLTLWIGPKLGRVERACLRSLMRQGHRVALYCYRPVEGVPAGVELRDGATILAEDRIIRHRSGSVALFANWFRYELMRHGPGIWVDTDQYLIAPIVPRRPHLFGWQDTDMIANGVLRIPEDSPLLGELIEIFEERTIPFWLPRRERIAAWLRRLATGRTGLSRMPWGSAGPHALTAIARKHGKLDEALAPSVFFPVHYRHADWIRDPARPLEAVLKADTVGVHLWNERIRTWKEEPAPAGSFLARLHAEGA